MRSYSSANERERRKCLLLTVAAIFAAAIAGCSVAVPARKVVIVHPNNPNDEVKRWERIDLDTAEETAYIDACASGSGYVEILYSSKKPEVGTDGTVVGSRISTWRVRCPEGVGVHASTGWMSGSMGDGDYIGSGCGFPEESDYLASPTVTVICQALASRTELPPECSAK